MRGMSFTCASPGVSHSGNKSPKALRRELLGGGESSFFRRYFVVRARRLRRTKETRLTGQAALSVGGSCSRNAESGRVTMGSLIEYLNRHHRHRNPSFHPIFLPSS